jgi:acyl carrier protein
VSVVRPPDVRLFLTDYLMRKLAGDGRALTGDLADDCDLLLSGIIDSLGLLDLVGAISQHFGRELTFDEIDPEQMTIVGPLCRFVAEQLSRY